MTTWLLHSLVSTHNKWQGDRSVLWYHKTTNARRLSSTSIVLIQQFLSFSCWLNEGIIRLNCCHRIYYLIKIPLGLLWRFLEAEIMSCMFSRCHFVVFGWVRWQTSEQEVTAIYDLMQKLTVWTEIWMQLTDWFFDPSSWKTRQIPQEVNNTLITSRSRCTVQYDCFFHHNI